MEIKDESLKYGYMKKVSIGYKREDGDFAIVATLNNVDDHWNPYQFEWLINEIVYNCKNFGGIEDIEVLEREDVPDYVEWDEWESELKPQIEQIENHCKNENIVLINKPWNKENG